MTIPISEVVNVSVSVAPSAQFQNGFATMLLMGISAVLPIGGRIRSYANLEEVSADFGTTAEEYYAADVYFSQSPQPGSLLIGRRFNVAVPGELLGGLDPDIVLGDYTAITAGSLKLTVDGTVETVTGINLSAAASLNAVAADVQTALAAVKTGMTCIWNGSQFIIHSGTTGGSSSVSLSTAPASGTDLGPMMGLTAAEGAIATVGAAAETVSQTLAAMWNMNQAWFYYTFTKEIQNEGTVPNPDILAAAAWAEANELFYGQTISDGTAFVSNPSGSTAATLKSLNYSYTATQYEAVSVATTDPYAVCALIARLTTVNYDAPNSTINLKFKQEPGISPVNLTESNRLLLEANNVNYYTEFGDDNAMIAEGVCAGGRWIDEVVGLAWLQFAIQSAIFAYLYSLTTKLPQTDKGVACITQVISGVLDTAVSNGLLAPGQWNAEAIAGTDNTTVVNTGDFVKKGYIIYAASVNTQSEIKREARIYDLFTIILKGAGAIQQVNVAMTFES
jgi:hypothetical protein